MASECVYLTLFRSYSHSITCGKKYSARQGYEAALKKAHLLVIFSAQNCLLERVILVLSR